MSHGMNQPPPRDKGALFRRLCVVAGIFAWLGALSQVVYVPGDNGGSWRFGAVIDLRQAESGAAGLFRLSAADAARYDRIFALQTQGRFTQADAEISALTDDLLMGHVLYQRYMHPTAYRSSFTELRDWLARYADHPGATQIHRLARSRQPAGEAPPRTPIIRRMIAGSLYDTPRPPGLTSAGGALASWRQGLAAWRSGDIAGARDAFARLAASPDLNAWTDAAAHYWHGRALDRLGEERAAREAFARATREPITFYGLLATERLGRPLPFDWWEPSFDDRRRDRLMQEPGGLRALALLDANQTARAEAELRRLHPGADSELRDALFAAAAALNLPALSFDLGHALRGPDRKRADAGLFPLPQWQPAEGYLVDRALLAAIMRRESTFDSHARSHAGAVGVMQLMPFTARHLAGRSLSRSELRVPEISISLGQRYVLRLMNRDSVGTNLVKMLASYNAGPTRIARFRRENADITDPLLFIESLPSAETRGFVERVLRNLWAYRDRLGQDAPSLTALAQDEWPLYRALDIKELAMTENDDRR